MVIFSEVYHILSCKRRNFAVMLSRVSGIVLVIDIMSSSGGWWSVENDRGHQVLKFPRRKQKNITKLPALLLYSRIKQNSQSVFQLTIFYYLIFLFLICLYFWFFLKQLLTQILFPPVKKKHQNKKLQKQLNETLNDNVIGKNTNANLTGKVLIEILTNDVVRNFERSAVGGISLNLDQGIEKNFANRIRKRVDTSATVVEICVYAAILTTMDNLVIPRIEIVAVRYIIMSSG